MSIPFTKIWREYHSPYYCWNKVKKYFKKPDAYFYKGKIQWFYGFPMKKNYLNSIIDIRFRNLGWKDKYDSPRFEWNPYISIVFFRKYQLLWTFFYDKNDYCKNMATWEAILGMIYYNKSINEVYLDNLWFDEENKLITIEDNLTDYGKCFINK